MTDSRPQPDTDGRRSQIATEPKPPWANQRQQHPGLESEMEPRPNYQAPRYKPAGKLAGKVALITGGDSGIGRAVAYLYAREGADVAVVYLPAEQSDAEEVQRAVAEEGRRGIGRHGGPDYDSLRRDRSGSGRCQRKGSLRCAEATLDGKGRQLLQTGSPQAA